MKIKAATASLLIVASLLMLTGGLPPEAAAGEPGGAISPALGGGDQFSPGLALLKAFGVLVLIIGLMLFIAAAIRKLGLHRGIGGRGRLLRVIETRPLGPKKYLAVVAAADQYFLVGVSDRQINLLSQLDDRQAIDRILQEQQQEDRPAAGFAAIMAGALKQRPPAGRKE